MKPAIALFARAPVPGKVKTRLIGRLTAEQACDLHRAFAADMWEMLAAFQPRSEVFLYTDQEHDEWRSLAGAHLRVQQGMDLGERMVRCFERMQSEGFGPGLILGSDSPALPASAIAVWTELVRRSDAVIGPAEDGGYYAIGCRAPHPRMFEGVEWSGPTTFNQTIAALERLGIRPALLPLHYDVDDEEGFSRLAAEPALPRHTRGWFERNHWSGSGLIGQSRK